MPVRQWAPSATQLSISASTLISSLQVTWWFLLYGLLETNSWEVRNDLFHEHCVKLLSFGSGKLELRRHYHIWFLITTKWIQQKAMIVFVVLNQEYSSLKRAQTTSRSRSSYSKTQLPSWFPVRSQHWSVTLLLPNIQLSCLGVWRVWIQIVFAFYYKYITIMLNSPMKACVWLRKWRPR